MFAAIHSLAEMPARCAIVEESANLGVQVRVLLHGQRKRCYKVYFAIHQETGAVRVFHIRHWARKAVDTAELADLMDESLEPEDY
jgi:hypothetical protein